MDNSQITKIFKESPCIKLIKSRSGEFILCFLSKTFSEHNVVSSERLHMLLESRLDDMEDIPEDEGQPSKLENNEDKAKRWIQVWTNNGFLTNYQDEQGEVMYEVSSYTSKVLDWVEGLKKEEYIGTESKFKTLFNQLEELVEFTNEDRQKRLEILRKRQLEIKHQIDRLQAGEDVKVYSDFEIVPRYTSLNKLAKELLSDFKEVDDNFKEIIKQIYQRQMGNRKKKEILNYIFDAYGELKDSPQGKSFYSFWEFLLSPGLQDKWDDLTNDLFATLKEKDIDAKDMFLKHIKQYLYSAGDKVYKTNDRMSEKLSRIIRLNEKSDAETTKRVIDDIKHLLLQPREKGELPDASLAVDELTLNFPFERQLQVVPSRSVRYEDVPSEMVVDFSQLENLDQLFNSHQIDSKILRSRVDQALSRDGQTTLGQILRDNELTKGLPEIFGYIHVLRSYKTITNPEKTQRIIFSTDNHKVIELPEIIITR